MKFNNYFFMNMKIIMDLIRLCIGNLEPKYVGLWEEDGIGLRSLNYD